MKFVMHKIYLGYYQNQHEIQFTLDKHIITQTRAHSQSSGHKFTLSLYIPKRISSMDGSYSVSFVSGKKLWYLQFSE